MQTITEQSLRAGRDRVWIEGRSMVILARHPMPDWTVREHQRIPVYFQDQKFFLLHRLPVEKPFAMRYELALCFVRFRIVGRGDTSELPGFLEWLRPRRPCA